MIRELWIIISPDILLINLGMIMVKNNRIDKRQSRTGGASNLDCEYCTNCTGCVGCIDCKNCDNCTDCIGCNGLKGKVGWVNNQPVEVDEYDIDDYMD